MKSLDLYPDYERILVTTPLRRMCMRGCARTEVAWHHMALSFADHFCLAVADLTRYGC